jgi:hypothetical protein
MNKLSLALIFEHRHFGRLETKIKKGKLLEYSDVIDQVYVSNIGIGR